MPVETEIQTTFVPPLKALRGNEISCKDWAQAAAMRMLMNNLDEEVGERPRDLVVYGGTVKGQSTPCVAPTALASIVKLTSPDGLDIHEAERQKRT